MGPTRWIAYKLYANSPHLGPICFHVTQFLGILRNAILKVANIEETNSISINGCQVISLLMENEYPEILLSGH